MKYKSSIQPTKICLGVINMRVAVASTNGKHIDVHFGDANQFFIFDISDEGIEVVELRKKVYKPLDEHSSRWKKAVDLIKDCSVVFCAKIGPEPKEELKTKGIKVIELETSIKEALERYVNFKKKYSQ